MRKRNFGKYITYRLQIGIPEMCYDLRKLGFDERKTNRLSFPSIPRQYLRDFVRGYFEGDGNVWAGNTHKDRKTKTLAIQSVFTSASTRFLEKLKSDLEKSGVEKGVLRKGKGSYFRLTYSVINSLKLYNFMYNDLNTSKLFLERKKNVFDRYIKMRL